MKNKDIYFKLIFNSLLFVWILFIPMKTSFYQISYILMIIFFLIYISKKKLFIDFINMLNNYRSILISFILIILSMTISNSLSDITTKSSWAVEFHYVFRYLFIFIILLFLYQQNFFTKKFILVSILISIFIQSADGIYQAIFGIDFIKGQSGNLSTGLTGATFNRNIFGMFMAIGASITIYILLFYEKLEIQKDNIIIIFFSMLLFLCSILFSYSRASWLFLATFVFLLLAISYKKVDKKLFLKISVIIVLIILLFLLNNNLLSRFDSLIKLESSHRFEIWLQSIELIKEKFFFGHGLLTYKTIGIKNIAGIHNSIIELFLYLGLFGFIAYTYILWLVLKQIKLNRSSIQFALFFSFLVITQFDHSLMGITTLSSLTLFAFFIFAQRKHNNALQ